MTSSWMVCPATLKVKFYPLSPEAQADEHPDVHFWSVNEIRDSLVPSTPLLRFLSNVHIPGIPLYLAVGPPTEVSTSNADTAAWLQDKLTPEDEDSRGISDSWSHAPRQLDIAILLGVEGAGPHSKVTEILLYAEVQNQEQDRPILSRSSPFSPSSDVLPDLPTTPVFLKVYALPLCSSIIAQARIASGRAATGYPEKTFPSFLKDGKAEELTIHKRKKLGHLFDDATLQRRRFNGRGGERILKAMSDPDNVSDHQGSTLMSGGEEAIGAPSYSPRSLSRNSSVKVERNSTETTTKSQGAMAHSQGSSLHRAESVLSLHEASVTCDNDSGFAQQNKAALTKVVLAGMRLHGLQQKKKRVSQLEVLNAKQKPPLAASELFKDGADEYKLIYHQTFKAAVFAFRAHFSNQMLSQDVMRDVVDQLLILFCTDPMITRRREQNLLETPASILRETSTAFDLPSSSTSPRSTSGTWSTVATKKRP